MRFFNDKAFQAMLKKDFANAVELGWGTKIFKDLCVSFSPTKNNTDKLVEHYYFRSGSTKPYKFEVTTREQ